MRMSHVVLLTLVAAVALGGCRTTTSRSATEAPYQTPREAANSEDAVYLSVVRGLIDQGQYQAALAHLDEYLKGRPKDPKAWALRGEAYIRLDKLDEAQAVFVSLDRARVQPEGAFGLGQVAARRNKWDDAVANFARAAAAAPTDSRILNNYGYALLERGNWTLAYDILGRATELAPTNEQIRVNYMIAAAKAGHGDMVLSAANSFPEDKRADTLSFVRSWTP